MIKNYDNIVINSTVTLYRNIEDKKFLSAQSEQERTEIGKSVVSIVEGLNNFTCYSIKGLSKSLTDEFLYNNVINNNSIINKIGGYVCVNSDRSVIINVNQDEIISEQCVLKGLNFKKAYDIINHIDDTLYKDIKFMYNSKFGYLTSSPTLMGTGLKAHATLFLPALTLTNSVRHIMSNVLKMGIDLKPKNNKDNKHVGYLYNITNEYTLGKTELETIEELESAIKTIYNLEEKAREQLRELRLHQIKNDIYRAFGVLTNSYNINEDESMELLSKLKLGTQMQLITLKNPEIVNDLLKVMPDVFLTQQYNKQLIESELDIHRAEYLKRVLKNEIKE